MPDLDFDVLMQGLAQQRVLLASLGTYANDKANIRNMINATIPIQEAVRRREDRKGKGCYLWPSV